MFQTDLVRRPFFGVLMLFFSWMVRILSQPYPFLPDGYLPTAVFVGVLPLFAAVFASFPSISYKFSVL
jgi:hypothetical protein